MRALNKRSLSFVLVIVLCISLLSGLVFNASAATVNYVTGNPSTKYKNVIKNWGNRGETATFLSPNAIQFYKDNNVTYDDLAALAGSSNTSSVPSSALYQKLKKIVTDNQTKTTTYDETRPLFAYTDCQNSGRTSSAISSFYSGNLIGPAWDSGKTWNREHTWPNSKGDANGEGENDIMMLRPTAKSENGSRSNTAYGESYGYYFPNTESGGSVNTPGKYDVRGDVARTMLYVYTRWGTANMWGSYGVIESKEVLLKWMAADPVDTWELGRNDSVESITGTRNVYVDYPELAFILFDAEIPENMVSPSNGDGEVPPVPTTPTAPTDPKQILEEAYSLGANEILPYTVTLTGKITKVTEVYSTQYKNITVVIEVEGCEGMPIKCYRMKGTGADQIAVGDTITVTGTVINYQHTSGDTEVEFSAGCSLDSWKHSGTTEPTEPTEPGNSDYATAPVADTAYHMGMDKNSGNILYFNGNTESASVNYRLATTTNSDESVPVYLESVSGVSGGYRLYFIRNNTKTYIRVYERTDGTAGKGKGSLELTTTAPAEYFTYDSTANTLVYTADADNAYYLGTYNTFSTFSVSNTSYITGGNAANVDKTQYPARFYPAEANKAIPGDLTGDGDVNNDDVVLLLWHTLFPADYPITVNGDLTGDNIVNNDDVVLLLWHTLFPEEYPL